MTLVEFPEFITMAEDLLSEDQIRALEVHIGRNPEAGDIIAGTGGVRKLRWAVEGKGKSGGVRVIYYFHNGSMPILLLTVYPKNVKDDLSQAERNTLKQRVKLLVTRYKEHQRQRLARKAKVGK